MTRVACRKEVGTLLEEQFAHKTHFPMVEEKQDCRHHSTQNAITVIKAKEYSHVPNFRITSS